MKKALLLVGLVLGFLSAIAQNGKYIPFPLKMISYVYKETAYSDRQEYGSNRFELQDDTVINGLHYSKYITSFKHMAMPMKTTLIGGIRNDVATKKVYLYLFAENKEVLLYDFDLHVGDTLFKNAGYGFYRSLFTGDYSGNFGIDTVWVSRIDSVKMPHDGLFHKRFNFNARYGFPKGNKKEYFLITSDSLNRINLSTGEFFVIQINPLIEGVGPDFDPVTSFTAFEYLWYYDMFCRSIDGKVVNAFVENGNPFYSKNYCESIKVGVNEEDNNGTVKVYPNPSNGKFNLVQQDQQLKFFEIYNLLGVKMLAASIQNNEATIDLSMQAKGVYFLRLYDGAGKSLIKKIIVE